MMKHAGWLMILADDDANAGAVFKSNFFCIFLVQTHTQLHSFFQLHFVQIFFSSNQLALIDRRINPAVFVVNAYNVPVFEMYTATATTMTTTTTTTTAAAAAAAAAEVKEEGEKERNKKREEKIMIKI